MPARKPTSKAGIEYAQKVARACELKLMGWGLQRIADEVGWASKSSVSRAIAKAMADAVNEPATEIVAQEIARLDAMLEGLWPRATAGNVRSVEGVLQIMTRRAKLLGLDDFDKRMMELAERRQALDEAQGAMVFAMMTRVFDQLELTPHQRALLPAIIPGEIERIAEVRPEP